MRILRKLVCFILVLLFTLSVNISVYAQNMMSLSLSPEMDRAKPLDDFAVTICLDADKNINLASFTALINFDEDQLSFQGIFPRGDIFKNEITHNLKDGKLTIVYLTGLDGIPMTKSAEKGVLDINFKVKKDADMGKTQINVALDEAVDNDINELSLNGGKSVDIEIYKEIKKAVSQKPAKVPNNKSEKKDDKKINKIISNDESDHNQNTVIPDKNYIIDATQDSHYDYKEDNSDEEEPEEVIDATEASSDDSFSEIESVSNDNKKTIVIKQSGFNKFAIAIFIIILVLGVVYVIFCVIKKRKTNKK